MNMSRSTNGMRISVLLLLAFNAGCNGARPGGNANDPGQANNANGTTASTGANGAAMGVPGSQPARSQGNSAANGGANSGPATYQSGSQNGAANQNAASGPVLSTRPANGNNAAIQQISVPSGTVLRIRLNETLNVKHTQSGQSFTGSVVDGIDVNGASAISRGASVSGVVDRSHRRGHFKGASILELRLTSLDQNGQHYRIDTRDIVRTKKGKGKRSIAMIGGGAGLGMLIGGVATGGVGLLVGGLAGGGAGTLGAAFTGNRDITIPAESVLSFRLADPIEIHPGV